MVNEVYPSNNCVHVDFAVEVDFELGLETMKTDDGEPPLIGATFEIRL